MRKKISNITRAVIILIVSSTISGCSKLIEIDSPAAEIDTDAVFQDSTTAYAALNGTYAVMSGSYSGTLLTYPSLVGSLTSDELTSFITMDAAYFNNSILPQDQKFIPAIWQHAYTIIYQSNLLIEGVEKSESLSLYTKNEILGQAKFLRAFFHFYLVNYYGEAPLITISDASITANLPRTPTDKIYEQIITDLKDAENRLTNATFAKNKVNKYAVASLLARVYLYQKNWDLAIAECNKVLNSNLFTPLPTPQTTFLANAKETIFEVQTQNGFTGLGSSIVPASSTPNYVLIDDMANSFETGDLRKTSWTNAITYNGKSYLYPYKYKQRATPSAALNENMIFLRAAEVLLIRSECYAHKNSLTDANTDLTAIRQRAGLLPISGTLTDELLLKSIAKERRSELFSEWSHRWFDLKRTNKIDSVLSALKPTFWTTTDALYPVPQGERNKNPFLSQNNGYN